MSKSNSPFMFLKSGSMPFMNSLYCAASSGKAASYFANSSFHCFSASSFSSASFMQCSFTSAGTVNGSSVQPKNSLVFARFSSPMGAPCTSAESARGEP